MLVTVSVGENVGVVPVCASLVGLGIWWQTPEPTDMSTENTATRIVTMRIEGPGFRVLGPGRRHLKFRRGILWKLFCNTLDYQT